jgi:hypothetical protein
VTGTTGGRRGTRHELLLLVCGCERLSRAVGVRAATQVRASIARRNARTRKTA